MLLPAHVLRVYVVQCRGGLNVVCRVLRRGAGRYMKVAGIVYTGSRCRGLKSMDVEYARILHFYFSSRFFNRSVRLFICVLSLSAPFLSCSVLVWVYRTCAL